MKQKIYSLFIASAATAVLVGCDSESTFFSNSEEGQLNCKALSVDYINSGTRATNVDTGDFTVNFVNTKTEETVNTYTYSKLPEIVSLPAGEYRAEAVYGNSKIAADWDNPFYEGSSSFTIEKGKITDDVEPIECYLQNIRVEVDLVDETGMDIIDSDVKVLVKAGSEGELEYDSEHIDSIGFFRYDDGSNTIIAELSGTLDGFYTEGITRVYNDASAGKAYRIRFHINRPDNVNDGDIQLGDGIKIDATIEIKDENYIVDPKEPEAPVYTEDMRPKEEEPENPGDNTTPSRDAPKIISETEGIVMDQPFVVSEDSQVKFCVTSETGITGFIIDINSDNLSPLLPGVGLDTHLDLVNPGSLKEGLEGLGFPTGDKVKGQKEVHFDISKFIPLLGTYGAGDHKFVMTITDANGTTNTTLWLQTKADSEPDDTPTPSGDAPKVISETDGIVMDQPFVVSEDSQVKFCVTSETGITGFIIDINSENLSPLLPGVGLDTHLDLVNPGSLKEGLEGLGFPTGENVKGQKEVHFDISEFIPLLGIYGAGDHKFIMEITDANGITKTTLWLQTK